MNIFALHLRLLLIGFAFLLVTAPVAKAETPLPGDEQSKPNIVMIFVDDWAWNGTPIRMDDEMENSAMPLLQMPNLEKLAQSGMKFRNAYSGAPQCSPSRVCLQTGKSSARSGFTVYMNSHGSDYFDQSKGYSKFPVTACVSDMTIDADAVTIPEALNPLGYACAHFGKWHMRGTPEEEGYIAHDGPTTNDEGNTIGSGAVRTLEGLEDPKLMFSVTERSLDFMNQQVQAENPFYLQISHYAMHAGSECRPETREKYQKEPEVQAFYKQNGWDEDYDKINVKADPAVWLGMGDDLDTCIGSVLDKIKELGIEDNTYIVLTSDNGYRHHFFPGRTQPLHGAKWWVWQGGLRVPMFVTGPDIPAGSVFSGNVVNYDLLPTFLDWAGGDPSQLKNIDGVSLAGIMRGKKPTDEFMNRYLYFHYPHYRTSMPMSAIVSGNWKVMHFYEQPDVSMLFDLSTDEGEVVNVAGQNPEKHQSLYNEMFRFFEEVGARIPKINPEYDPSVYQSDGSYEIRKTWGPFEARRPLEEAEK